MKDNQETVQEKKIITYCLLEGKTLKQIADKLHCAKSTASYKTRQLFDVFKANDRYEFVVNVFTNIIDRLKTENLKLKEEIQKLRGQDVYNNESRY